ncbi:hypothetical protein TWF281_000549 [Arthrobotrys megalospora]
MKHLLFTIHLFSFAFLYFPSIVLSVQHHYKIGTNEHIRTFWGFVVKSDQRKNTNALNRFKQEALKATIPPRKFGVYEYKSDYSGTWAFLIDGAAGIKEDVDLKFHLWDTFPELVKNSQIAEIGSLDLTSHFAGPPPPGKGDGPPQELPPPSSPTPRNIKRHSLNRYSRLGRRASDGDGDVEMAEDPGPMLLGLKTTFQEMLMVSQPPKVGLVDMRGYRFEFENAGTGVKVYVIDTGVDPSHEAFDHQRDKLLGKDSASWIYSGPLPSDEKNDEDLPNFLGNIPGDLADGYLWGYHGTMTAGKIVGSGYGLASSADLVAVKVQTGRNYSHGEWGLLDALLKVYDDILRNIEGDTNSSIKGVVISVSYAISLDDEIENWKDATVGLYQDILGQLEKIKPKVYFVSPTGNKDTGQPITYYPQSLILEARNTNNRAFKQCLVVGGVKPDGTTIFQEGLNVDLYAPAYDLAVPIPPIDPKRPNIMDKYHIAASGTSYGSAFAAGLLAALISEDVENPVTQMKKWAYPRRKKGHKVIWNGITEDLWADAGGEYQPVDRKRPPSGDSDEEKGKEKDRDCSPNRQRQKLC